MLTVSIAHKLSSGLWVFQEEEGNGESSGKEEKDTNLVLGTFFLGGAEKKASFTPRVKKQQNCWRRASS